MSVTTFDKLAYVDSLKAHGVAEDQARAHAAALDTALHDVVATKADIEAVRADMATGFATARAETFRMILGQTALLLAAIVALLKL